MSRIKNSFRNLITSAGGQLLIMVLGFVTRSVFIGTLGTQYLGINGLFSNIISMLSLADLGIGTAITFNLYKPIANDDEHKVLLLMNFYKKIYRIIGCTITVLGVCLIPFLPYLIKDDVSFINVTVIFLLYLFQSVSSYLFFAYKSSLIKANQKEYIITGIGYFFTIATNIVQIVVLVVFENFMLYICTVILFNILRNLAISIKYDKMYPFTKEKPNDVLDKRERKEIFKNCYALFLYKVNAVVLNATDNLVLSAFIGLNIVGIYSNYLLIIKAIKSLLVMFYNAVTASLGNLHATSDLEHECFIFRVVNLMSFWMFGVASIGVFVLANEFISIWIGSDYILPQNFVLLISIDLYMYGTQKALATFRTTMGLFQQSKYRPVFGIVINLVVSIILVQYFGIHGVILGTIIANLLTYTWFDPYIIYKHGFKKSVKGYYIKNIVYYLVVIAAGGISYLLSMLINVSGIPFLMVCGIISVVVPSLLFFIFFGRTKEFMYIASLVRKSAKN